MVSKYIKQFCKTPELIENYDKAMADMTQTWECHHRLETKCPVYKPTVQDLKDWNLYYDRPSEELIFLTKVEHTSLHMSIVDRSNEWKTKISLALKGKSKQPVSEEIRKKISEANKGRKLSEEHKAKISAAHKGKPHPQKGHKLSEETKRKISEAHKGKTPWNKGKRKEAK